MKSLMKSKKMYKKILAGAHKKYPIIIGKKSICKEFLPKAIKNNSKVMIITDFGVPKEIIESIDKILKKESKIVKIHKIAQVKTRSLLLNLKKLKTSLLGSVLIELIALLLWVGVL